MFGIIDPSAATRCRYASMAACEAALDTKQGASIPALALFQVRARDSLDFGIDATDWLVMNGNAQLTNVVWSIGANSPKSPVIGAGSFDPAGLMTVQVTPAPGALAGDAYYLDATITVGPVAASAGQPALPARTLVRRIHLVVVNG